MIRPKWAQVEELAASQELEGFVLESWRASEFGCKWTGCSESLCLRRGSALVSCCAPLALANTHLASGQHRIGSASSAIA